MPRRSRSGVFSLTNFQGLDLRRPARDLTLGQATIADNVEVIDGAIRRRLGWSKPNTSGFGGGFVRGIGRGPVAGVASDTLWVVSSALETSPGLNQVWKSTDGVSFTKISTNTVPGSSPSSAFYTFASIDGRTFVGFRSTDGIREFRTADVTSFFDTGTVMRGPIASFQGSLWGAGSSSINLYWSRLIPNLGTLPTDNFVRLDGTALTGLAVYGGFLLAFTENRAYRVSGTQPDDAAVEAGNLSVIELQSVPGCVAAGSVVATPDGVLYLSRHGIFLCDGYKSVEVSEPIRPIFGAFTSPVNTGTDTIATSAVQNTTAIRAEPYHYLISFDVDAIPTARVYSIWLRPRLTITRWVIGGVGGDNVPMVLFPYSDVNRLVFGANSANNTLGRFDTTNTDNGTAISWEWRSGALFPNTPPAVRALRRGWVWSDASGQVVTVKSYPDDSATAEGSQAITLTTRREKVQALGLARDWAIALSGSGTGAGPVINTLDLETSERATG